MAQRPPLSDFQKLQRQVTQQRNVEKANRIAQDREADRAKRSVAAQYIPGGENLTMRQIDQSFRTGDVGGALRRTAVEGALADSRLGQYRGEMAGGFPLLDTYAINQGIERKMGGMPQPVSAEGMAAYRQLGGNIAQASQLNVPLSALQSRQNELERQRQAALSAGAEARIAEGQFSRDSGLGDKYRADASQTTAMTPATVMSTEAEAARRRAEATLFDQQATSLGQVTGMQMRAFEQGGGKVLPPGMQIMQPAPGPEPISPIDAARIREIDARIEQMRRSDPAAARRLEYAKMVLQTGGDVMSQQDREAARRIVIEALAGGNPNVVDGSPPPNTEARLVDENGNFVGWRLKDGTELLK